MACDRSGTERTYKIGEFAAMTGMTSSKVRFYDKAGLFTSGARDENGYRAFTPHDAFRANAFRVLLQYGFTVEKAIAMLDARQGTAEFEASLQEQRARLAHDADLLRYRLRRIDSALDLLAYEREHQKADPAALYGGDFTLVDIDDQVYIEASHGSDFSVSVENRSAIADFYELLSITNCARIIGKADLENDADTVDPSYVICMPAPEAWRLDGRDPSTLNRLEMGKCLRYRRQITRAQSIRKEAFAPLFTYLERHGYRLRGDVLLLPGFMNLDGQGADIETLLVPVA